MRSAHLHFNPPSISRPLGSDSPRWTISAGHRDLFGEIRSSSPDPCCYQISKDLLTGVPRIPIRSRPDVNYETVTSHIEEPLIRVFPSIRTKSIGKRQKTIFCVQDESPAYLLPKSPTFTSRRCTIGHRLTERIEDIPGPGQYSPRLSKPMMLASIPKMKKREIFNPKVVESPGPGKYNVREPITPRESWHGAFRPIPKPEFGEEEM